MKRTLLQRHGKKAGWLAGATLALGLAGKAWDLADRITAHVADEAAQKSMLQDHEQRLCALEGGRWWQGSCEHRK